MKKSQIKFFSFTIILIPIIGMLTGSIISNNYKNKYETAMLNILQEQYGVSDLTEDNELINWTKIDVICTQENNSPIIEKVCKEYNEIKSLTFFSSITLVFTLLMFVLIFCLGQLSLTNRNILLYIFRPALFISQMVAAVLVCANSFIFIFSIYLTESAILGIVHTGLLGGLCIIAGITTIKLLANSFKPTSEVETKVFGKILSKDKYPKIWEFIGSLVGKVGAELPDTIIAGIEPTFFVTEAKVICFDGEISGRTLFISLPFCRTITMQEFSAIIGHEMGHFIGSDTKWSRKFYPIYRRAIESIFVISSSSSDNPLAEIALTPASIFMRAFFSAFETSERAISRQRELKADNVGMKISSKEAMASALVKVHAYQHVWSFIQEEMKKALLEDKMITNLSTFFAKASECLQAEIIQGEIGNEHTPHPVDTHPPLSVRLNALGVSIKEASDYSINNTSVKRAITLIEDPDIIEEELSELQHYVLANQENEQNTNTEVN